MTVLPKKYSIVTVHAVSCTGQGKSIVDAINGLDKNTILKLT